MIEQEQLLNFKSVVEMFDITPRTLRYYEYLELLTPKREGRTRYYSKREIGRLKLILQGRRFGFKLEEIRQMLELYNPQSGNREQIEIWIEKADARLEDLRQRYLELGEVITELEKLRVEAQEYLKDKDTTST